MLYELDKAGYAKVWPLFRPLDYQPFCTAVLAGVHPGRVFVDADHPQAAFVVRDDGWCFLAGNPGNDGFNRALNQAIFSRSIKDRPIVGEDVPMMLFTCHPQDWGGQLATVFNPRQPIPASRRHYVCRELAYDWPADIPDGFVVRRMDKELLTRPGLKIPDEVRETLDKWRAMDNPRLQDFGFVAIHQGGADGAEIASWATVDAIVDGVGDAGLFTVEAYRRRGLAAVTAAAAVAHGLSQGLSAVSWTCAESNIGSVRTAEKLGFERESDYTMYYFVFDEAQHMGNLAYSLLQDARYREAVGLFERVLALGDTPFWVHYDAACAWAALGDRGRAFEHLNAAIDGGWTDVDSVRECKEFQCLRGTPEWEGVLERLQRVK